MRFGNNLNILATTCAYDFIFEDDCLCITLKSSSTIIKLISREDLGMRFGNGYARNLRWLITGFMLEFHAYLSYKQGLEESAFVAGPNACLYVLELHGEPLPMLRGLSSGKTLRLQQEPGFCQISEAAHQQGQQSPEALIAILFRILTIYALLAFRTIHPKQTAFP